jgi:hypothetical protein
MRQLGPEMISRMVQADSVKKYSGVNDQTGEKRGFAEQTFFQEYLMPGEEVGKLLLSANNKTRI